MDFRTDRKPGQAPPETWNGPADPPDAPATSPAHGHPKVIVIMLGRGAGGTGGGIRPARPAAVGRPGGRGPASGRPQARFARSPAQRTHVAAAGRAARRSAPIGSPHRSQVP